MSNTKKAEEAMQEKTDRAENFEIETQRSRYLDPTSLL